MGRGVVLNYCGVMFPREKFFGTSVILLRVSLAREMSRGTVLNYCGVMFPGDLRFFVSVI